MNENDFRDVCAIFAMHGLLSDIKGIYEPSQMENLTSLAYKTADAMVEARNKEPEDEGGIATIKKRKYVRKT